MKLQTQIPLKPEQHNQIDYYSKLLLLGSCFVENIGSKLNYFKFQNTINPFGILFHPIAIQELITNAVNEKTYIENDIFFHNEQWHCFDGHSQLSTTTKDKLLESLNRGIEILNKQITQSTHIIITLGTAWVYRHVETDRLVANCHKVPQKQFLKELLSVDMITESLESIIALIKTVNSNASVLFTVSPIRHLKDGFLENTQSKSHLLAAIHQVVAPRKQQYYFPSYEIMMDELRDYRFYKDDMIHPNQTAINYIWEKFQNVWISESSKETMQKVDDIQKGLAHKTFNPNSESHKLFLQQLDIKQSLINKAFPFIKF